MCESGLSDDLRQRAHDARVALEFTDWHGVRHVASEATVSRLVAALVCGDEDPWLVPLPPCVVTRDDTASRVDVHVRSGADAEVRVKFEDGGQCWLAQTDNWVPDRIVAGVFTGEASFILPVGMPLGYHSLVLVSDGQEFETTLIVTPSRLPLPAALTERRCWGFALQLYSVPSRLSWGIGDFSDLGVLAVWAAGLGADYLLVNPLHAPGVVSPVDPSPYAPASRRFISPIYIRPEATPEYAIAPSEVRDQVDTAHRGIAEHAASWMHLHRDQVWRAKGQSLRTLFGQLSGSPLRRAEFDRYCAEQGDALSDFATWCALSLEFGADWREWDAQLQHPHSREVLVFRESHSDDVEFFCWLQLVASEQLSGAQAMAKQAGMAVGIVTDLAVGVQHTSADTWACPTAFVTDVSIGAPPDDYNQLGQEWGMSPFNPRRLAELAYVPLIEVLRSALSCAGGVRMDHILGAFRQWWVPSSMGPSDGAYVGFDHEAVIGIIVLEAMRSGALVVGEDLGTLEPWVREYLNTRGLLGTTVLWFESEQGCPKPPSQWRELSLASVTTHDLPPTAGYLNFEEVHLRHRLGLLKLSLEEELIRAEDERRYWLDYVSQHPLDEEVIGEVYGGAAWAGRIEDETERHVAGLYHALAMSPCRALNVALADAVGEYRTQNQPGTIDEYPNWRLWLGGPDGRRLWLEDVLTSRRARRLAAVVQSQVGGREPPETSVGSAFGYSR